MLDVRNLSFTYPHFKRPVIDDISLRIDSGGIYALLGPNGAGKSTLLYLISGLLTPQKGSVELFGVNTRLRKASTLSQIFLVPEEFTLPSITVDEYAKVHSLFYPLFSDEDFRKNLATFELDSRLNLGRLSMGQKKKAMMCFALATNTPLLIMDEPTNGLDIPSKMSFRGFIASHMTEDRAIIISTHQVADVSQLIDHVIIMDQQRLLLNQPTWEISQKLSFFSTTDPVAIANAIISKPTINGTLVVAPNFDDSETEINLEMLFELATSKPEYIEQIFQTTPPAYEK